MAKYDGSVPPEAQAAFLKELQSQGGDPGEEMSPEQQQAAEQQGAQDAQADLEAAGADTPDVGAQQQAAQQQPAAQQPDPSAQILAQYGFSDLNSFVQAFQQTSAANAKAQEQLLRLTNIQKAMENTDALDDSDPTKATILGVLQPLLQETQDLTRGQMLRDAWNQDSQTMADLQQFMPDIQAHLKDHPELSVDPAGLRRAYDAVRSRQFRTEDQLLADPKFLEKAKGSKQLKDSIIADYLNDIQRGKNIPASVGAGGSTPLSGEKPKPKTMDEAFGVLTKMLGG